MDLPNVGLGAGFLGHKPHGLRHPLASTDNTSIGGSLHDVNLSTGMPVAETRDQGDASGAPAMGAEQGTEKGPAKGASGQQMPAVKKKKYGGTGKGTKIRRTLEQR